MSKKKADSGSKPADELIRATMRSEGLLIPDTEAELERFEEELVRSPVEVPAHLLDPMWLFRSVELPSVKPPAQHAENRAIAARKGTTLSEEVTARMREDHAAAMPTALQGKTTTNAVSEDICFSNNTRLSEISELAEWISQTHFPKAVVEPQAIAASAGIGISFNDYDDAFDGLLEHSAGRFHIYCNLQRVEAQTSERARFTLAHELGHYFIDAHRRKLERGESLPISQCEYESAQPIEREADHFAAHLLMPTSRFTKCARGLLPGIPGILALRRHFGTSVTSTVCRYAELGVTPCVVVKWSNDGVGWRFLGPAAREAGLGRTISSAAELPSDSATALALTGTSAPSKGYFERGTTAASWFRSITNGSFRNAVLVEQAMPLGRFGAITLLFPAMGGFTTIA